MRNLINCKKIEYSYECKLCNFKCSYKSNYDTHLSTRKHKMMVKNEELSQKKTHTVISSQLDTTTPTTEYINTCKLYF